MEERQWFSDQFCFLLGAFSHVNWIGKSGVSSEEATPGHILSSRKEEHFSLFRWSLCAAAFVKMQQTRQDIPSLQLSTNFFLKAGLILLKSFLLTHELRAA